MIIFSFQFHLPIIHLFSIFLFSILFFHFVTPIMNCLRILFSSLLLSSFLFLINHFLFHFLTSFLFLPSLSVFILQQPWLIIRPRKKMTHFFPVRIRIKLTQSKRGKNLLNFYLKDPIAFLKTKISASQTLNFLYLFLS